MLRHRIRQLEAERGDYRRREEQLRAKVRALEVLLSSGCVRVYPSTPLLVWAALGLLFISVGHQRCQRPASPLGGPGGLPSGKAGRWQRWWQTPMMYTSRSQDPGVFFALAHFRIKSGMAATVTVLTKACGGAATSPSPRHGGSRPGRRGGVRAQRLGPAEPQPHTTHCLAGVEGLWQPHGLATVRPAAHGGCRPRLLPCK